MANTNCLAGMQCPNCKSEGPFSIVVKALALVGDDGVEEYTEPEWEGGAYCVCPKCDQSGFVDSFNVNFNEDTGKVEDRCPHGMFRSGAGACPQCGKGAA